MTGFLGSPWTEEHPRTRPAVPLAEDDDADVVIVGGGISGLATAYCLAEGTDLRIILLESGLAGHGATGNNGGQAVEGTETEFEELASTLGRERAEQGFRELAGARKALEGILGDIGRPSLITEVTGALGLAEQDDVEQWAADLQARKEAGMELGRVRLAEDAPSGLLGNIPRTSRDALARQLWSRDRRYIATIEMKVGLINTFDLVEALIEHLQSEYPERVAVHERSPAALMRFSGEDVTIGCNGRIVVADSVVLCTNGYLPPRTEACVPAVIRGNLRGVVGYMVGGEGGSGPEGARALFPGGDGYYYITRRKYRGSWLTAAGGPEGSIAGPYDPGTVYHPGAYERLESFLSSTLDGYTAPSPRRWQGLMGYTSTGTRIAGRDPGLPVLHYNLGCNGIGIMSAVAGAKRLEDLMAGRDLEPSMFDPEAVTGLRGNGRARERLP